MTNVRDVPASEIICEIARDLKENKKVIMPEFATFVKTGCSRERAPENADWWYVRMASILRKVYVRGKVTVKALRTYYGSKKNRGVKPEKFRKASGKIIRVCLQDLEKLGFVKISEEKTGRIITSKGQQYLDKIAADLFKKLYPGKRPFETSTAKKATKNKATTTKKVEEKSVAKEEAKVETKEKKETAKKEVKKEEKAEDKKE